MLDAPAERLVREGGRVIGVDVRTADGTRRVLADAVVVATGGFSQNPELLARFAPQMEHALRAGGAGCEGDGLLMAWQLGAGVVDTPYIKATYGHFHEMHPDEDGTGILAVYKGAIAVNREGRRFVDESRNYKEIGDRGARPAGRDDVPGLRQPRARGVQRRGADLRLRRPRERRAAGPRRHGRGARGTARPAAGLAGRDGRGLQRRASAPAPATRSAARTCPARSASRSRSSSAPFFAHPSGSVVLATYCGLTVDTDLRVLDVFGEPIERLYAAGEVIGGFHGAGYITGTSIGKAGIFGRLAGTHAAAEESELEW